MTDLTWTEAVSLLRTADGACPRASPEDLARLVAAGLLRCVSSAQAAQARAHRAAAREAAELREQVRRLRRPRGLRDRLRRLHGPSRQAHEAEARRLDARADELESAARAARPELSRQRLLDLDEAQCARGEDGSFLAVTARGRQAALDLVYDERFEREVADDAAVAQRVQVWRDLRGELLRTGFPPDARLDLAAAALSRDPDRLAALLDLNRPAVAGGWRSLDRLPMLARLALLPGGSEGLWERCRQTIAALHAAGLAHGAETRLAAVQVLWSGYDGAAGVERLGDLAGKLRYDGWPLNPTTDVVAARLMRLRLSPAQIAGRAEGFFTAFRDLGLPGGTWLGLAAAIAADTNLLPEQRTARTAQLMETASSADVIRDRFREALPQVPAPEEERPVAAALLALMPGTVAGNLRRLRMAVHGINAETPDPNAWALAAMMLDAAFRECFDAGRYVWEIGCVMALPDPMSVFGACRVASPMWSKWERPSLERRP